MKLLTNEDIEDRDRDKKIGIAGHRKEKTAVKLCSLCFDRECF